MCLSLFAQIICKDTAFCLTSPPPPTPHTHTTCIYSTADALTGAAVWCCYAQLRHYHTRTSAYPKYEPPPPPPGIKIFYKQINCGVGSRAWSMLRCATFLVSRHMIRKTHWSLLTQTVSADPVLIGSLLCCEKIISVAILGKIFPPLGQNVFWWKQKLLPLEEDPQKAYIGAFAEKHL